MYEKINDKKIDAKFKIEKLRFSEIIKLFIPKILTAASVGIDKKKDILAESYLLKFKNLAVEIVIPDLLTPGTKDSIWRKPIIIADFKLKFFLIDLFKLILSEIKRKIPKIIVVHPINLIFLNWSIKLNFTNKKPTNITGIDDIIILKNNSLFSIKFFMSSLK